jgi:predicted dehydrogenase/threonine dehydrogenase-like Zn-dependent dehydrogenase
MKQVLQHIKSGETVVSEVPVPLCEPGTVLVRVEASLVSVGTERMVVDFAQKNLVQKARSRPDLVAQTVEKARREGVLPTIEAVQNRLDRPMSLGYSCAGTLLEVGDGIADLAVGNRVACAGTGAAHAEVAVVGRNLVVPLADSVAPESAAFVTLGAIALQGIRLAEVTLGDVVAVVGLGLLGQLTVQMLRAAGCIVLGTDPQPARAELALRSGAAATATTPEEMAALCRRHSNGHGVDAVLITADTKSNGPVELAGEIGRDRAIVVAVGAVGTTLPRKPYYEKELDFRISRSYGPGRYDPAYEDDGHDYPIGYVRWTENRNMAAFAQLLADRSIDVEPLISHRFPIEDGARAYDLITGSGGEPFLGVVLMYPHEPQLSRRVDRVPDAPVSSSPPARATSLTLGLIGAGNFATATLLPAVARVDGIELVGVATSTGLSAHHAAAKAGFRYASTDVREILGDPGINTAVILTRHNLHAGQAIEAMRAGKDVFVEKPLALDRASLVDVIRVQRETGRRLMVGFNRRFAPMVTQMRDFLAHRRQPLSVVMRVNAGAIPPEHWTQDPAVGGGRIVGEACHFIDLLQHLIGVQPERVVTYPVRAAEGPIADQVTIVVMHADGSVGTVLYSAGGDRSFGKERFEAIGDGCAAVLDDYRSLELVRAGKRHRRRERLRPDKGHRAEWEALVDAVRRGTPGPIPLAEIVTSHLASYAAVESLLSGSPVAVDSDAFWTDVTAG